MKGVAVVCFLLFLSTRASAQSIGFVASSTSIIAGAEAASFTFQVKSLDANGQGEASSYSLTLQAAITYTNDGATDTQQASVTLSFGVKTVSLPDVIPQVGTAQTVTFTVTNPPSGYTSEALVISLHAGSLSRIDVTMSANSALAGESVDLEAIAYDSQSNILKTGPNSLSRTISVAVTGSSTATKTNIVMSAGEGSGSVSDTRVGTITLSFSNFPSGATINLPTDKTIDVSHAATSVLTFSTVSGTFQEGDSVSVEVTAFDEYGNVATTESRDVALTVTGDGSQSGAGTLSFTSGVATKSVSSTNPQQVTVGLTAGTDDVSGVDLTDSVSILFAVDCDGITEYQDEAGQVTCKTVSPVCQAGFRQTAAPTKTSDRACVACNGITEYQDVPDQTTCKAMTSVCSAGTYESVTPSSSVDRVCTACDGPGEYQDTAGQTSCKTVAAECTAGFYQSVAPTTTNDRVCTACDGSTEYQDAADQTSCKPMTVPCVAGNFESVQPSASNDRECTACNGVDEYQNLDDQSACKEVTECINGQEVVTDPTATSDRVCRACPLGFFDDDSDPATPCTSCSAEIIMTAVFNTSVTGAFNFTMAAGDASTNVTGQVTGLAAAAARLVVLQDTTPVEGCPSSAALYNPTSASDSGCASDSLENCAVGDIAGKLDLDLASAGTTVVVDGIVDVLPLTGSNNIQSRTVAFLDANNNIMACARVDYVSGLTFQSATGQTSCQEVTLCPAGQREVVGPSTSADRICANCPTSFFQPDIDQRFCLPWYECPLGEEQSVAPSRTSDRECQTVTCTGLTAPTYGDITACPETVDFGTFCNVTCDTANNFTVSGTANRVCEQSGTFSGTEATCVCLEGLYLDPNNVQCVDKCPSETYALNGVCTQCASSCAVDEEYEVQECSQDLNTNRVCTSCRVCPTGEFKIGGCIDDQNTVCDVFSACDAGEFEVFPGNATHNKKCDGCTLCPEHQFAETGCCKDFDAQCTNLTLCSENEFEAKAPLNATQGGYDTDRVCQRLRTCTASEYEASAPTATSDRNCSACSVCPADTYASQNCSDTADTVCSPISNCTEGSYILVPATAYSDVVCAACTACSDFEYQAGGCIGSEDTVCELATICHPVTQYETSPLSATADRECMDCTVCGSGEFLVSACNATADAVCASTEPDSLVCPRGETVIGTEPDTACFPCRDCPEGEWASNGPTCPRGAFTSPECVPVSTCNDTQYEMAAPTALSDRICRTCSACPSTQFKVGGCNGTQDTQCQTLTTCGSGEYQIVAPGAENDRVCAACTSCDDDEFIVSACTATSDTVCRKHAVCDTHSRLLSSGSARSDSVCGGCAGRRIGRSEDPTLCPDFAENVCYAVTTTTTTVLTTSTTTTTPVTFSVITITLEGDFDAIKKTLDEFESQLVAYIATLLGISQSAITELRVYKGSIIVDFLINDDSTTSTDYEVSSSLLQNLVSAGNFTFVFGGTSYSAVTTSFSSVPGGEQSRLINKGVAIGVPVGLIGGMLLVLAVFFGVKYVRERETDDDVMDLDRQSNGSSRKGRGWLDRFSVKKDVSKTGEDPDEYLNVTPDTIVEMNGSEVVPEPGSSAAATDMTEPSVSETKFVARHGDGSETASLASSTSPMYHSPLSEENEKLRQELEGMREKLVQKELASVRSRDPDSDATQVEMALAARLKEQNTQLKSEISKLRSQLQRRRHKSKVDSEAMANIKLKAERAQLEEELAALDQVTQVQREAAAELAQRRAEEQKIQDERRKREEKARLESEIEAMKVTITVLSHMNQSTITTVNIKPVTAFISMRSWCRVCLLFLRT
eukprot:m.38586 g.38586  ORF g.38586 m.38586 type:complete len:1811 (+) comp10206_c0_seq2:341-5773(+)